jgi:NAD(P)-dependent dehydrogenase (short-subunit alcohol dehydrogenase family)
VFISSESGICPPAEMVHYGMTKAAQLSVARGLAETCTGTGVTVNSVLPGPTRTEGVEDVLRHAGRRAGRPVDEAGARLLRPRPAHLDPQAPHRARRGGLAWSPMSAVRWPSATHGAALRVEGGVVRSI